MMGLKERAFAPLVSVSLEELVPQDHFYRHLQQVLDLSFVHQLVRERYAVAGRPSIDPIVFFKLQLVMFFENIRSERFLMRQVADRLSLRWYIGYDLDEPLPDHSTLSKIRQRYGLEVFRRFCEAIVQRCQEANLVWGKELYFDSSAASMPMRIWTRLPLVLRLRREKPSRSTSPPFLQRNQHSLKTSWKASVTPRFPNHCQQALLLLFQLLYPLSSPKHSVRNLRKTMLSDTTGSRKKADNSGKSMVCTGELLTDLFSTTDPDATPMRLKAGGIHLGYHTHYVVDGGKRRIILAVLVVPREVMDNQPMLDLLWYVSFRWRVRPRHVTGDTTYGTFENIKPMEDAHIRASVPFPDWEHKTAYDGPAQFTYDVVHDQYRCPQGQLLLPTHREEQAQLVEYRASAGTCNACPLKPHCTPNKRGRHVHRSFFADYQERVKGYHQTDAYQKAMDKRKVWVEPLFAEARILAWHAAIPLEEARALSIARRRSSQRGKISNACFRSEVGDGVRFQRRGWLRWLFPRRKQMSP